MKSLTGRLDSSPKQSPHRRGTVNSFPQSASRRFPSWGDPRDGKTPPTRRGPQPMQGVLPVFMSFPMRRPGKILSIRRCQVDNAGSAPASPNKINIPDVCGAIIRLEITSLLSNSELMVWVWKANWRRERRDSDDYRMYAVVYLNLIIPELSMKVSFPPKFTLAKVHPNYLSWISANKA